MKRLMVLGIPLLLFLSSCCGDFQKHHAQMSQICMAVEKFDNSFSEKNREMFLDAITQEDKIIAFGTVKGENHFNRQDLIEAFDREAESLSEVHFERDIKLIEYSDDCSTAWVISIVNGYAVMGEVKIEVSDMRSTMILRKQKGQWVIVHVHTSLGSEL